MSGRALGIALALVASAAFQLTYVLLTEQARSLETTERPNASYFGRLLRRPWYLGAMALNGLAFGCELLALRNVSLVVVQPLLSFGLVALVIADRVVLHEPVHRRQVIGAVLVAGGVSAVIIGAPRGRSALPVEAASIAAAAGLGAILLLPQVERHGTAWRFVAAAAAGDTLVSLGANEAANAWPHDVVLLVVAVAIVGFSGLIGTTSESAALQRLPVFRVAPIVVSTQTTLPVILVAVLGHEHWSTASGHGALLAPGVAVVVGGVVCLTGTRAADHRAGRLRGQPSEPLCSLRA